MITLKVRFSMVEWDGDLGLSMKVVGNPINVISVIGRLWAV